MGSGRTKLLERTKQKLCLIAGFISLGLGIIGIFLPVMPTAPFVIIAAFFFSKGSEKWHQWLLNHPHFGPSLREWLAHGVIRTKHKILSTVAILGSVISISFFVPLVWLKITFFLLFVFVLLFIWTRPSLPSGDGRDTGSGSSKGF